MSLQSAAQDLLVLISEKEPQELIDAAKDTCGSDEWDDYSQQVASFVSILRHLAGAL